MKKNIHNYKNSRGFTVLETLVAIAVLIVSLTAAFSVAQSGLSTSMSARDEVSAYYLAQEAVEMIKNIRDNNSINGDPWLTGIANSSSDPCYFGNYCIIDSPNEYFAICNGSTAEDCPLLKQDKTANSVTLGMYGAEPVATASWDTTNFRRSINIKQINSDEIAVNVTVSWSKGAFSNKFVMRENVFNWQR